MKKARVYIDWSLSNRFKKLNNLTDDPYDENSGIGLKYDISFVQEFPVQTENDIHVKNGHGLEMIFAPIVWHAWMSFNCFNFRMDDDGYIRTNLPFEFDWSLLREEINNEIEKTIGDYNFPNENEFSPMNILYLEHIKSSSLTIYRTYLQFDTIPNDDSLFLRAAERLRLKFFTIRQVQVMLKKLFFKLNSTERDILTQVRRKIKKAIGLLDEVVTNSSILAEELNKIKETSYFPSLSFLFYDKAKDDFLSDKSK